jgi:hypothetical protein
LKQSATVFAAEVILTVAPSIACSSTPWLTYLEGRLEIMSPSRFHEKKGSRVGHLVEAYCLHAGIEFEALESWTLEKKEAVSRYAPSAWNSIGCAHARPRQHGGDLIGDLEGQVVTRPAPAAGRASVSQGAASMPG